MNSISKVEYFYNRLLVRVSFKLEIKKAIITENDIRFVLAYNSPLLQSPQLDKIGILADSEFSIQLLIGKVQLDCSDNLQLLLSLFTTSNYSTILSTISLQNQNHYQLKAKESTSSSISRIYFDHYKVQAEEYTLSLCRYALVNLAIKNSKSLL